MSILCYYMFTDRLSSYIVCIVSCSGYFPTEGEGDMHHATWRTRATRGAGAPEEKLPLVSDSSVDVSLLMDDLTSLKLTLRKIVRVRERDGYTVVEETLTLACSACGKKPYETYAHVQLEDLSAARSAGQLHLSECKPKPEAEEEAATGQKSAVTPAEQPGRTYCD